ncbi:MAG: hypothetical protein R3B57_02760 [Phycisphaerales bacterium]
MTDAFEAPPGAVPYWLYLQAQNIAARLRRGIVADTWRNVKPSLGDDAPARRASAPHVPDCSSPHPDTPRLGEILPVPREAPEQALGLRRYVTTREVATGRIFDAVF